MTARWVLPCSRVAHVLVGAGDAACGVVAGPSGWKRASDGHRTCVRCAAATDPDVALAPDVLAVTGASYRQIDHWVRVGYLRPADAQPGSGYPRLWPPAELAVAAVMARLVGAGLTPAAAHRVARGHDLAPGVRVLIDPPTDPRRTA